MPLRLKNFFGISAQVDFNFDKKYSMGSDSVVALIRHEVKKSQTLLDINNLKLSEYAKSLDPVTFRQTYGNAFIAGFTDGCSFDIKIERKAKNGLKNIEFDLKAEYDGIYFNVSTYVK